MESSDGCINYWKGLSFVRVTGSQKVCLTPAFVFSITTLGDGSGNTEVDIHNGESTNDEVKMGLRHSANDCRQFSFDPPVFFSKGIYVNDRGNVGDVTIQFLSVKE